MAKKARIDVSERDERAALKHSPFAALGQVAAAASPAPAVSTDTELAPSAAMPKPHGRLLLRREKKRRAGKTVVVISGFETRPDLGRAGIDELAQRLKQQLGCGGAVEHAEHGRSSPEIVLQGDQPVRVAELLQARGFRVAGVR